MMLLIILTIQLTCPDICSLKEEKEGRFDLEIDGVSHHSWFRRKKDEFMEAIGLPTSRRQNRGLKL